MNTITRPSTLPKLAACRAYVSKEGASEAAARGSALDAIIRKAITLRQNSETSTMLAVVRAAGRVKYTLTQADMTACEWAVDTMLRLADDTAILTEESELAACAQVEGLATGTMDACIPALGILADFKTGQIRDYEAQMAAYALACMQDYFSTRWTTVLLFIDKQETRYQEFSMQEARELVENIVNAEQRPTVCEYCGWCAHNETCELRRSMALEVTQQAESLEKLSPADIKKQALMPTGIVAELAADPEKAAQFCEMAAVANSYAEAVKGVIKERIGKEGSLGRFKLRNGGIVYKVPETLVGRYISEFGHSRVLAVYGPMSASKFEELWKWRFGDDPPPRDQYLEQKRADSIVITKPKS